MPNTTSERIAVLEERVDQLILVMGDQRAMLEKQSREMHELLQAWNASLKVVAFMKLLASLVTAVGIIWGALTIAGPRGG